MRRDGGLTYKISPSEVQTRLRDIRDFFARRAEKLVVLHAEKMASASTTKKLEKLKMLVGRIEEAKHLAAKADFLAEHVDMTGPMVLGHEDMCGLLPPTESRRSYRSSRLFDEMDWSADDDE